MQHYSVRQREHRQTIVFAKNITLHIGIDSEYANGRRARESGTRRHAPRFSRRARASLSHSASCSLPRSLTPAFRFSLSLSLFPSLFAISLVPSCSSSSPLCLFFTKLNAYFALAYSLLFCIFRPLLFPPTNSRPQYLPLSLSCILRFFLAMRVR